MAEAIRVHVQWPAGEAYATLMDTRTTRQLVSVLPCEARANTWGDEVYFAVPARGVELEPDAQQVVAPGTVCFWVEGNSLALPFGATPISHTDECRLAARTNILGSIDGDPRVLASVRSGDPIALRLAAERDTDSR